MLFRDLAVDLELSLLEGPLGFDDLSETPPYRLIHLSTDFGDPAACALLEVRDLFESLVEAFDDSLHLHLILV